MLRIITFLFLTISFVGCAAPSGRLHKPFLSTGTAAQEEAKVFGLVFGKTSFEGLLKTAYVRLTIIKKGGSEKLFYYVGSKANQSVVPWGEGKVIEPGYFLLELLPGDYEISSLAIPVGSTIAEEPLTLDFSVVEGEARYLGTLKIDGTKDKVRFGGVPVMKPGFEYVLSVDDDMAAAVKETESVRPSTFKRVVKDLFDITPAEPAIVAK